VKVRRVLVYSRDGSKGYDALHRLLLKTYSDGTTPQANYVYDVSSPGPVSGANVIGRLRYTSRNSTGSVYNYDAMGRVATELQCIDYPCNWNSDFTYTYDLLGDMTTYTTKTAQWTNPPVNSITFNQSFDSAGRVTQLTSSWVDGQHPGTLATADPSVGYFPNGALRKVALGNNLIETAAYNNRLQPCRINVNTSPSSLSVCGGYAPSGTVLDFTYGFNLATSDNGNVASWSATGQQTFTRSFTYDSLNRIASMQHSAPTAEGCLPSVATINWTIDAWGNRTNQSPSAGTCGFSQNVNTQNQLLGAPYQYDTAGNMIQDASHTYTYDAENHLIAVDGGSTASYAYDPLGRRAAKTAGGTTTSYTYDLAGNVVFEYQGSSGWQTGYLYFAGALKAEYNSNGQLVFIHKDHLGSTRLVTAVNQSVSDNMDYLPYGEQIAGASGTTHKFTGDEHDSETNLEHTWFRQSSSSMARWTTPDPAGLAAVDPTNPQSWNRYAYVLNNPLNLVDPMGLDDVSSGDCGAVSAVVFSGKSRHRSRAMDDCGPGGGGIDGGGAGGGGDVPLDPNGGNCDVCQVTLQPGLGGSSNLWQDGTSLLDLGLPPGLSQSTATSPTYYADDVIQQLAPQVVNLAQGPMNFLTVMAGAETLGMGGVAGLTSLEPAQIAIGSYAGNLHFAAGVGGQWIHGLAGGGLVWMTSTWADEFIEEDGPLIIPILVRNGSAVLNTAGTQVRNCFTGMCGAVWNGWIH
jgi:RHS repeat-associated protein